MDGWLKQSTAYSLKIGPFVDDADGNTAETGLTLSQADIRLSTNGGDYAQKHEASAATADELGYYDCPVDATDTGTLGLLKLAVHESGALPVWHTWMIVTANVWNSLCSTDILDCNAKEVSDDSAAADSLELWVENAKGTDHKVLLSADDQDLSAKLHVDAKAISASTTAADNVEANIGNLNATVSSRSSHAAADVAALVLVTPAQKLVTDASGHVTAGTVGDKTGYALSVTPPTKGDIAAEILVTPANKLATGAAGVVTVGTNNDKTGYTVSTVSDKTGYSLAVTPPTGAEIAALILTTPAQKLVTDASGHVTVAATSLAAIVDAAWDEAIAVHLGAGSVGAALNGVSAAPSAATVADAVWDELAAGHVGAGSLGKLMAYLDMSIDAAQQLVRGADSDDLKAVKTALTAQTLALQGLTGATLQSVEAQITALSSATPAAIADAICDEALSGHTTAGTVGKAIGYLDKGVQASETVVTNALAVALVTLRGAGNGTLKTLSDEIAAVPGSIPAIASIADAVWDELLADHSVAGSMGETLEYLDQALSTTESNIRNTYDLKDISDAIAAATFGSVYLGGTVRTYTVTDESTGAAIEGVKVEISSDADGDEMFYGDYTDNTGSIYPPLKAGTFYFWRSKRGYRFANPDSEVFA